MITGIEFKNLKGQSTSQELCGMDIFTGKNGAGKTTRVQALSYAMLGYLPGQKKTPADTFKLATGKSMSVGLTTETFAFTRTLNKTEKKNSKTGEITSSIKESLSISPGAGERTDSEKKLRVLNEMGNFPVMLDFNEFLSMTDTGRRDFIYSLSAIESSTWNRERLHKYLVDSLLTSELQSNDNEQYETMQEQITKAIAQYPNGFGISEGLQSMLDWAEVEKKFWTAKQKDAQGAVRQISDLKNELEETERGINDQKSELSSLESALIVLEKEISTITEQQKAEDERIRQINLLIEDIKNIENEPPIDISVLENKISDLQAKLQDVPDISEQLSTIFNQRKELKEKIRGLETERNLNEGTIATIESTIKTLEDAIQAVDKANGRCIAHHMVKCPKDFSDPKLLEGVRKNKAAAYEKITQIKAVVKDLNSKIDDLFNQDEALTLQKIELEQKVSKINTSNSEVLKELATYSRQKDSLVKMKADHDSKLAVYKDTLAKGQSVQPAVIKDITKVQQDALNTREKINAIKLTITEKEKAKQALILVKQSMLDNTKAEYTAIALKLIYEKLGPKGVQGELVKEIIQPICNDITSNLHLMGFNEQPFFDLLSDTGKEIFQFGWINEKGHKVNFDALSTGQQTVFLAAMMVTIIDRANPKLKILLMDNLNHLDRNNFQLLLNGLAKVKDKLHNIILAGAIEFEFEADGWKVWNLGTHKGVEKSA